MTQVAEATYGTDYVGFSNRFLVLLFGVLTIASLVPIWIDKYFPSQNGPEYLLAVQMVKEYFNSAFNYSDYYYDFGKLPTALLRSVTSPGMKHR